MRMEEPFQYEPLDLDAPAFRLVRILMGDDDDDIECELFQAYFNIPETQIGYESLSYTWGSQSKSHEITLNGCTFPVTKNLFFALKFLRHEDEERIMWIDAICIDQENHTERGHQVQQMADIYSRADRVVIWLGNSTWQTDILMHAAQLLQEEHKQDKCKSWDQTDQRWSEIWQMVLKSLNKPTVFVRDGLRVLLNRSWWKRIWILQEAANAKNAIVVCGPLSVSVQAFALIPLLLGETPDAHCQAVLDILPGPSREKSWWNEQRDLRTLLHKFGQSRATDERDMIYALIGLSSDAYRSGFLVVDYNIPVQQVIERTVSFLFSFHESGHNLERICSDFNMSTFLSGLDSLGILILKRAVEVGDEALVKELLDHYDADINHKDRLDRTPLHLAARKGQTGILEVLLEQKAIDVNLKDYAGRTTLALLAGNGYLKPAKLILKRHDVDVYSPDIEGKTPLWYAIENKHDAVVQAIVRTSGLKPDLIATSSNHNYQITSTFDHAVKIGHNPTTQELFRAVDVTWKDQNGQSILTYASRRGISGLELLLAREDIHINSKVTPTGQTPLSYAAQNGNYRMVKRLLQQSGVDVNSRCASNNTPLSYAITHGHVDIVELLLKHPAINLNLKTADGKTALSSIVLKGNLRYVEAILSHSEVDPNTRCDRGRTALDYAAMAPREDIVELLLKRPDLNVEFSLDYLNFNLKYCYPDTRKVSLRLIALLENYKEKSKHI